MTKKLEFFRVFVLQKMVLFASFLHFFPQASRNAKSIVLHFRKIDLKKSTKTPFESFMVSTSERIFRKKVIPSRFPELFFPYASRNKMEMFISRGPFSQPPDKSEFLFLFWYVWTSVFCFPRPKYLSFCRVKIWKSTVFWRHFVAFQRLCTARDDL